MSRVGFRALSANGYTQIDDLYANHALLETVTLNISANSYQTITVTGTAPLLAFAGGSYPCAIQSSSYSNGVWTFRVAAGPNGATGTCYVFDAVSTSSQSYGGTIGLVIRNTTTGAITYDSRRKYLRIASVQTIDPANLGPPEDITTGTVAANLAALIANPGLYINEVDSYDQSSDELQTHYYPYQLAAMVNGTTLYTSTISTGGDTTSTSAGAQSGTATLMLVDLSGY